MKMRFCMVVVLVAFSGVYVNAATWLDTLCAGRELSLVPASTVSEKRALAPVAGTEKHPAETPVPESIRPSASEKKSSPLVATIDSIVKPVEKAKPATAASSEPPVAEKRMPEPIAAKPATRSDSSSMPVKKDSSGSATSSLGFRIQIYNSKSFDAITVQKKRAEKTVDLPIYMAQENGQWKLFVGDYRDRTAAEKDIAIVKQMGFGDAWIVQARIVIR